MSASQSNLSEPKFGYDLVVAVTQVAINVTMEQFLAGVSSPEVIACYVYDKNNNLVSIDYDTLKKQANGSDPFSVPAGSNPATDPDLINLTNANFAGAVKAQIGLPDVGLPKIPPIVTLGSGTSAPVLFNLLCSEFQITGFNYGPRNQTTWLNQSQPTGDQAMPWYFSANVSLNSSTVNPQSKVPPAVQQRIQQLINSVGPGAFSIQQLFLDLDTAILDTAPSIVGIPAGWPVWNLITNVFLGAYFGQLQQSGQPVLGYAVAVNNPQPETMQLGSISHECCALLNNGQPITNPTPAELNASTFVYLGTASTTPPTAVMFPWNWVELGDITAFSGVQAVRSGIFFAFFAGLLNNQIGPLCQDTNVSLTHDGDTYYVLYSSQNSSSPATFNLITPIGQPGTDGFTSVLNLSFSHNSHDGRTQLFRHFCCKRL